MSAQLKVFLLLSYTSLAPAFGAEAAEPVDVQPKIGQLFIDDAVIGSERGAIRPRSSTPYFSSRAAMLAPTSRSAPLRNSLAAKDSCAKMAGIEHAQGMRSTSLAM